METLQHIAFIIDGNRRWAKQKGLLTSLGHREGGKNVEQMSKICVQKHKIPYITYWVLSTENVKKRSESELNFLFELIDEIPKNLKSIDEEQIKIHVIGNLSALPEKSQKTLFNIQEETKNNTKAVVTLAVNYGGHDEIIRTYQKLLKDGINAEDITDELLSSYLDTSALPNPDLIVRTGGNKRLSGFMPWQSGYSELYFTDVLWPDFDETELSKALEFFQNTQRNFGK